MKDSVLDELSLLDWGQIGKEVTAVATYWSKVTFKKRWKELPEGHTIKDVVQEAIRRAFSREWDVVKHETILKYLFNAVRGIISNLARDFFAHNTENFSDLQIEKDDGEVALVEIGDSSEGEDSMVYLLDYNYFISKIENRIKDNDLLMNVFNMIRQGSPPRDMANKLKITRKEVYVQKKKLVRLIDDIAAGNE